jgi:hypothetical protein
MMAGAGRELAIAERAQDPAHRRLAHRDPELLPHPHRQVFQPPAYDPMDRRGRTALYIAARASRWELSSLPGLPGAWRSAIPSGPCALNLSTQSRIVCKPTPPTRAAFPCPCWPWTFRPRELAPAQAREARQVTRVPERKPETGLASL